MRLSLKPVAILATFALATARADESTLYFSPEDVNTYASFKGEFEAMTDHCAKLDASLEPRFMEVRSMRERILSSRFRDLARFMAARNIPQIPRGPMVRNPSFLPDVPADLEQQMKLQGIEATRKKMQGLSRPEQKAKCNQFLN